MDAGVALSAFALLFLAEMGDKTQLVAMTLATRHRAWQVALGACAAFLLLNLLAVLLGEVLFRYVPERVVLGLAGLLFLAFAWNAWRSADDDAEATGAGFFDRHGPTQFEVLRQPDGAEIALAQLADLAIPLGTGGREFLVIRLGRCWLDNRVRVFQAGID